MEQTRSVIDHARDFHEQLAHYYHGLADVANQTRVRLLLDYMSDHEERLAKALAEYEDSAPASILNTWLQSPHETDSLIAIREHLQGVRIDPSIEVDDVIETGIKLSEHLLEVYRDLARQSEPESVRQVFENLLRMEEKAQQQFARDAGRLSDL